jgi:hypothetical protein
MVVLRAELVSGYIKPLTSCNGSSTESPSMHQTTRLASSYEPHALTINLNPVRLYRAYTTLAVPAAARHADSRIPLGKWSNRLSGVPLPIRAPNEGPDASCARDMQTVC